MQLKLIDNWRQWPRMYSQWAFATIGGIQASILAFVSPEILAAPILFFPSMTWGGFTSSLTAFLAISGFFGRLISQDLSAPADSAKD
ncbi:MAG: hypothetical protein RL299_927 [Pseudomonadota bacterium]|jgi:hypothetical protein